MRLVGGVLIDTTYTIYNMMAGSVALTKGDCAVYVDALAAGVNVRLPNAAENVGQFIFVILKTTQGGEITIKTSAGDSLALNLSASPTPVTSLNLVNTGEFVLLFSSGLFWHWCAGNY